MRGEEGRDRYGGVVPIDLADRRQHQYPEDEFVAPVRAEGFEIEILLSSWNQTPGGEPGTLLPVLIQAFAATASDTMSDTGLMSVFRETRAGSVVSMTKVSPVP